MTTRQSTALSIPGMSCQHCVQTITTVLATFPDVQDIQVDLATKTAHLTHDAETSPQARLETALAEAGYPVSRQLPPARGKALPLL